MKTKRIIVVGSLNMDIVVTMDRMPQVGETVLGREIHYVPGGKGANQAVGCARLGAQVHMIGAVGDDSFGSQLLRNLENNGVDTVLVQTLKQADTGIAAINHTEQDNSIVVVPGANGRLSPDMIESMKEELIKADLMLIQLEIPLTAVEAALRLARNAGLITVLNPAPAAKLPPELLRLADYLTPNESEFSLLSGSVPRTEEELEALMTQWQKQYGNRLVITRGKKGCSYLNDEGRIQTLPSLPVQVVDTTGAGDAFNAALGFGLASGYPFAEAARFAVRAASLSVSKFGAQGGLPTFEEVMGI